MNTFLLFLIKSTLSISLLYLAFQVLMRKEASFKINRMILIFSVVISVSIPFLHLPQSVQPVNQFKLEPIFQRVAFSEEPIQANISREIIQPSASIPITNQPISVSFKSVLLYIYLSGVLISILMLIYSIGSVFMLFRKARKIKLEGIRLMIVTDDIPAFSFGRSILISQHDFDTNSEAIITHEQSHIRLGHFYDLILMELVKIIFWFNPLVYRMVSDLKEIHEFQADNYTLNKGIDATQYQLLIIQKGVGPKRFALANSFNHCQIKKRIIMMNKQKTSKAWRWKVATFLPLLALLLMAFGNRSENVPRDQMFALPLPTTMAQDSIRNWSESDFNQAKEDIREKLFFNGKNMENALINANSELMVSEKRCKLEDIPDYIRKFRDYDVAEKRSGFRQLTINGKEKMVSDIAIIVRKDLGAKSDVYQQFLNQIGNTILSIRGKYAKEIFGKTYQDLLSGQQGEIDKLIPLDVYVVKPDKVVKNILPPPVKKKTDNTLPPPPPPTIMNLAISITINGEEVRINRKTYSLDELKKMLNEINPKNEFISIDTHSTSSKELVESIKSILEKQKINYRINWSSF